MIKDFSRRTMKKMQLLMSESHSLYIHCHGIENPLYLFGNLRLTTLERGGGASVFTSTMTIFICHKLLIFPQFKRVENESCKIRNVSAL